MIGGRTVHPVTLQQLQIERENGTGWVRAAIRSMARSETATGDMPGGAPRHFWVHELRA